MDCVLVLIAALWNTPYLGWVVLGLFALGLCGHFFWRYKTRGWTQPWGGWNDMDTARE